MSEVMDFSPDYVVLPGESISEMLEECSMTQKELATRMEVTEKTVSALITGKVPINQEHAKKLELILGLPSSFWMNLQRNYDDAYYEKKYEEELSKQIEIAEKFPQETLKNLGLLPKGRNKGIELVKKLLKIFRVQNLNQVLGLYNVGYDCRISNTITVDEYALVTWMRLGEIEFENKHDYKNIPTFNPEKVSESIDKLRAINLKIDSSIFLEELKTACYELGILFVVVPEVKGSRISGMARWISIGKRKIPLIQLSLRGKRHDMFWFTFFHELGHVLLHRENEEMFIDVFEKDRDIDGKEKDADDFARDTLIGEKEFNEFKNEFPLFVNPQKNIIDFSGEIDIHPGIVVGRLQKEGILDWSQLNRLKTTYKWEFEK